MEQNRVVSEENEQKLLERRLIEVFAHLLESVEQDKESSRGRFEHFKQQESKNWEEHRIQEAVDK